MFSVFRSVLTACSPWILDRKSFLAIDVKYPNPHAKASHHYPLDQLLGRAELSLSHGVTPLIT